jgi:YhcH/YjgK/YiaL family protein
MKKQALLFNCILFFLLISFFQGYSQNSWNRTAQQANTWFKHGEWERGLHIKPDPSINAQEFAIQYHLNPYLWERVLAFLNRKDLISLPPGKYPVAPDDSAFATISIYNAKPFDQTKWESHRKYIDVQYVIKGSEKIGVGKLATAKVIDPYDPAKDIAHYTNNGNYYLANPSNFFIFFPQETHRPGITPGRKSDQVKKLVIKVMVMK